MRSRKVNLVMLMLFPLLSQANELPDHFLTFFDNYCIDCHDTDVAKGDFHIDLLGKVESVTDAEYWQLTLDNLHLGEMPPEDKKQPGIEEVEEITEWIQAGLTRAATRLEGHTGEVVLRRLNRTEYQYTIKDLFDVDGDFAESFPKDVEEEGFDHIGASLALSAEQLHQYRVAAEYIINRAIVTGVRPETMKKTITLNDLNEKSWNATKRQLESKKKDYENMTAAKKSEIDKLIAKHEAIPNYGYRFPAWQNGRLHHPSTVAGPDVDLLIPTSYASIQTRDFFYARQEGWYRVKLNAFAVASNNGEPVRLRVESGSFRNSIIPDPVDVIFYQDDTPQTHEYRAYLERGQQFRFTMLDGENWAAPDKLTGLSGPFIAVREVEMEGPLFEQWPPQGHQFLLGKRDANQLQDDDLPEILAALAPRLFRRTVGESVIDEFTTFYTTLRHDDLDELEAFKLTVQAMMVSPWFLYHVEAGDGPDDYAIANRLTYFLWRSTPDDKLFSLAKASRLSSDKDILSQQVERLLNDNRGERFLKDFVGQWLQIDQVGEMQPDSKLYREYDTELETSMTGETEAFIREMLVQDLPLHNFIKSDWAMLNSRIAKHYGLEDLLPETGNHFQKVSIDPVTTRRGGLLTQASILNITSNGTVTSPVVRGAWILENLLGTPPSPPPPDVPAIEPDIRGATTIKEQLAKHREIAQCASCHRKIDPYGMALENFDVIGGWRETYRALQPTGNPNRPRLIEGNAVEMAGNLPRLGEFSDLETYRNLLLQRESLLYENMAHKLAVFALGRKMDFADQPELKRIAQHTMEKKAGIRTIIHELVKSELFFKP